MDLREEKKTREKEKGFGAGPNFSEIIAGWRDRAMLESGEKGDVKFCMTSQRKRRLHGSNGREM